MLARNVLDVLVRLLIILYEEAMLQMRDDFEWSEDVEGKVLMP